MKTVQSLDRALEILMLVSSDSRGLRIADLEKLVHLPKSTIHRLLNTLLQHGFVEKCETSTRYKAGARVVELASVYLNNLELKTEARPYLLKLARYTGGAAHLAVFEDMEARYIDKVEDVGDLRLYSQIGRSVPLHCTGVGKVLLSGLEEKRLLAVISEMDFKKYTSRTITGAETLTEEIGRVRENGVAYDREEHEEGITCVAAPIYDYLGHIIAAISVSGKIPSDRMPELEGEVVEAARGISLKFGYSGRKKR